MTLWDTTGPKRREVAVQSVLDLIPLFEAEALWESIETSRAIIASLRDVDFPTAWRLFCGMDTSCGLAGVCASSTRDRILAGIAALGSILQSMISDCCEEDASALDY